MSIHLRQMYGLGYLDTAAMPRLDNFGMHKHIPWQTKAKHLMDTAQPVKLTQQMLADALHVSKGTVSHWFNFRHQPSLDRLERIASVLKTTASDLIADDETFIRGDAEMLLLRAYRAIDREKQEEAIRMVIAVLNALTPPEPKN